MSPRMALAACVFAGCTPGPTADTPTPGDTEDDVVVRETATIDDGTPTTVLLVSTLAFVGEVTPGVAEGFDLDALGTLACNVTDQRSPDGEPDIDNSFARAMPRIVDTIGWPFFAIPQDAVLTGRLLVLFELTDFDATAVGGCVPVRVLRGMGRPEVGGEGRVLPFQTFERDPALSAIEAPCANKLDDDSLEVDDLSVDMPLSLMGRAIPLTLTRARARLVRDADGWRGLLGGGIPVSQFTEGIGGFPEVPEALRPEIIAAFERGADLRSQTDGPCDTLSATMAFQATPAFLFDNRQHAVSWPW